MSSLFVYRLAVLLMLMLICQRVSKDAVSAVAVTLIGTLWMAYLGVATWTEIKKDAAKKDKEP